MVSRLGVIHDQYTRVQYHELIRGYFEYFGGIISTLQNILSTWKDVQKLGSEHQAVS